LCGQAIANSTLRQNDILPSMQAAPNFFRQPAPNFEEEDYGMLAVGFFRADCFLRLSSEEN